ncbi:NADP-dependent malic enzyme-like isoform X2 [Mytilus californianus]|uniref:NADP-dependent malic enzyme-like isoform X2 n=1 Tax=Mytilus californianus TaxID=6549 RepID=UPI002248612B|nr:NADP-dependent malic enzyme-like isoform X2 [Mytilus californianus]
MAGSMLCRLNSINGLVLNRCAVPAVAAFSTSHNVFGKYKIPKEKRELINHSRVRGIEILRNPKLNKGHAFTLKERQLMGIHGLLPAAVVTQDQQMNRVLKNFEERPTDVDKYTYLMSLSDRNEKLFYRCLTQYTEKMMPIVYTPTVGKACQQYGVLYRKPRGLFLSIHDAGHLYDMICNWPEENVEAVVATDGERILGLGDLGAYGMGIPVGKLALYTALGGIPPEHTLPVMLDVGTNNKKLQEDPLYIGNRNPRVTGKQYDDFIDEFMEALIKRYGIDTLIQFEDFANNNAFRFLEKYRDTYCMFNDDIQGTASVAAAGIIASMRITGKRLSENTYLFQGAGEANIGIAHLISLAMEDEGVSHEEAISRIWMVDSRGLLVKDRPAGGITGHKELFCKAHKPIDTLGEAVKEIKPSAIIGAAAVPHAFTEEIVRDMAKFNDRPIIFALSNPTSMAECTAEEAYQWTDGRCVFASGSPFDPVTINGKTLIPGQGNNAYIFPGVALAVISCKIKHIDEPMFLKASQTLSGLVTQQNLEEGRVYPPLSDIREVSVRIATALAEYAYSTGAASAYPEPEKKEAFIRNYLYHTEYESFIPETWSWPEHCPQSY